MYPTDDQSNGRVGMPVPDQRQPLTPPTRNSTASQNAAADVIRGQLDAIYSRSEEQSSAPEKPQLQPFSAQLQSKPEVRPEQPKTQITKPQQASTMPQPELKKGTVDHAMRTAPIAQTQTNLQNNNSASANQTAQTQNSAVHTQVSADQWKQYHSAWQKYYQMYYERYYAGDIAAKNREISRLTKESQNITPVVGTDEPLDPQKAAIKELRSQIQQKVRDSANKVKKSRHFVPAIAGLSVLLVFMFLQYNRVIFGAVAAYTTPGAINPQNIIVDASTDVTVGPEPRIIIPKINVDAPVIYGAASDTKSQSKAMEKGVAHFSIPGASAVPGEVGNAVFAAHSSNDAFASGDYKFVFAQNEKLTKGDIIYMNYNGKRYTYKITSTEVVMPTEVSKVQINTDKPMLTLVSCVPLGTAEKRLLIFAEQISPDPSKATATTATSESSSNQQQSNNSNIPGKPEPTLLEKLFGGR